MTIDNGSTKSHPTQLLPPINPPPTSSLNLYRRLPFGRKHLFAPSPSPSPSPSNPPQPAPAPAPTPAQYFILNPVPHKHASSWRPVFYRGGNPKYDTTSKPVARALRTSMWNAFQVQVGDGRYLEEDTQHTVHISRNSQNTGH